jgi:hypothetical protein
MGKELRYPQPGKLLTASQLLKQVTYEQPGIHLTAGQFPAARSSSLVVKSGATYGSIVPSNESAIFLVLETMTGSEYVNFVVNPAWFPRGSYSHSSV